MRSETLNRIDFVPLVNFYLNAKESERMAATSRDRSWRTRLLIALAAVFFSAGQVLCSAADYLPVSPPRQAASNPCFSVRTSGIRLVDGNREPAIELVCGGILTWDVPQGASSFHVTLWRAETANAFANSQPAPTGEDSMRVIISLDGRTAVDTILRDSTPAEQWSIPTNHAHTLSITMEQEYGAFGVYLGDPGFSSQPVQAASVRHVLSNGQAYVNLGTGLRQGAFFDFHPGEMVPLQAEFAGNAQRADIQIHFLQTGGQGARNLPIHIPLHADATGSVGSSQWQVPQFYGPSLVGLTATINGQQVYSATYQVALAKAPDPSAAGDQSNFGIHESTNGSLFLQDEGAALWGAKWARFFIDWNIIEAKQGQYDWHWIDNVVQAYSAQHLALMGVMGDLPPQWMTDPATQMKTAYARFVSAALEHFKGRINVWDVYNEIDAKFYSDRGFNREDQPSADIQLLRQELQQMVQFSPGLVKICCAAAGSDFLVYEKRLFDAGLLVSTNAVEMHPYQAGPPEESDYGMNYVEMAQRLAKLTSQYGQTKQVWTTESNWLFGPAGTADVSAPQVTEHEQSQYLVRCSLLSLALHDPYFIHSPFFFPWHRSVLVDSLASYSELTSLLVAAQDGSFLSLPPHLFGVVATAPAGTVVALWTDSLKPAFVRVSGMGHMTVQDMYGNPLPATDTVQLTGSPVYLVGQGTPVVSGVAPAAMRLASTMPAQRILPPAASWQVMPNAHAQRVGNGQVHITSSPTKYGSQLKSEVLNVSPNSCYVIEPSLVLHKGGVNVQILDPDSNKLLRNEFVYAVTGNDQYDPKIRAKTEISSHMQVVLTGSNPHDPAVSDFEVGDVKLSDCP
jgi:hypothetical protein